MRDVSFILSVMKVSWNSLNISSLWTRTPHELNITRVKMSRIQLRIHVQR